MAFQPVPACTNAAFRFTDVSDGRFIGAWSLNFKTIDSHEPTELDLQGLRDTLKGWWSTSMDTVVSIDCQLQRLTLRNLDPEEALYLDDTPNLPGTQVGERLGSKTTLAVAFKTFFTGRSFRGRAYQVGLVETQVVQEYVTNAYAGALIAAWEQLPIALETDGVYEHVVVSRWEDGVKRLSGIATKVQSYILTDLALDVQRDRFA